MVLSERQRKVLCQIYDLANLNDGVFRITGNVKKAKVLPHDLTSNAIRGLVEKGVVEAVTINYSYWTDSKKSQVFTEFRITDLGRRMVTEHIRYTHA